MFKILGTACSDLGAMGTPFMPVNSILSSFPLRPYTFVFGRKAIPVNICHWIKYKITHCWKTFNAELGRDEAR